MILEGRVQRTIKEIEKQGRHILVSQEITNKINYEIGEVMTKTKTEFNYLVELGVINYIGKR